MGTKWKPHEPVEFKHVVEVSERLGRMSDDSMLMGHIWNQLQEAKGGLNAFARLRESIVAASNRQPYPEDDPIPAAVGRMAERIHAAEAKVVELREEVAGLLASADADAHTIGNLNARIRDIEPSSTLVGAIRRTDS